MVAGTMNARINAARLICTNRAALLKSGKKLITRVWRHILQQMLDTFSEQVLGTRTSSVRIRFFSSKTACFASPTCGEERTLASHTALHTNLHTNLNIIKADTAQVRKVPWSPITNLHSEKGVRVAHMM